MKKNQIRVNPSILSGDFGALAEEAKKIETAGADAIHIDIMDGHFVPNLTLGPKAVGAINRATPLFLDVHLMIYNPFDYVEAFVEQGADRITFHFEATEDVEETLLFIRRCGRQAGLAFRPETSFSMMPKYLDQCDLVLLMTVNPGFGGQKFIENTYEKIIQLKYLINEKNSKALIEIDGGVDLNNYQKLIGCGADVLVAGNTVFSAENPLEMIDKLKKG